MVGAGPVHLGTFGGLSLLMHASSSDALTCISPVVSKGPGHLADGFTLVCTEPGSLACLGSISDLMCRGACHDKALCRSVLVLQTWQTISAWHNLKRPGGARAGHPAQDPAASRSLILPATSALRILPATSTWRGRSAHLASVASPGCCELCSEAYRSLSCMQAASCCVVPLTGEYWCTGKHGALLVYDPRAPADVTAFVPGSRSVHFLFLILQMCLHVEAGAHHQVLMAVSLGCPMHRPWQRSCVAGNRPDLPSPSWQHGCLTQCIP